MAATPLSKGGAEKREGSTPSLGTLFVMEGGANEGTNPRTTSARLFVQRHTKTTGVFAWNHCIPLRPEPKRETQRKSEPK